MRRVASFRDGLLDLLVERVPLEMRVVFFLLNALGDGLFVARGEIARGGFPLFLGFGAFQGDEFLHDVNWMKGQDITPPRQTQLQKCDQWPEASGPAMISRRTGEAQEVFC